MAAAPPPDTELTQAVKLATERCTRLSEMIALLGPGLGEFGRRQLHNELAVMNARAQRLREELCARESDGANVIAA